MKTKTKFLLFVLFILPVFSFGQKRQIIKAVTERTVGKAGALPTVVTKEAGNVLMRGGINAAGINVGNVGNMVPVAPINVAVPSQPPVGPLPTPNAIIPSVPVVGGVSVPAGEIVPSVKPVLNGGGIVPAGSFIPSVPPTDFFAKDAARTRRELGASSGDAGIAAPQNIAADIGVIQTPALSHPDIAKWYEDTGEYGSMLFRSTELANTIPNLYLENLPLLQRVVQEKGEQLEILDKNFDDFLDSLEVKKAPGNVPYMDYLPEELDVLYVGVEHAKPVEKETYNIVKAVQEKYEGRNIYLATEYVPNTPSIKMGDLLSGKYEDWNALNVITTGKELTAQIGPQECMRYKFLLQTLNEGVPVVGIEPNAARIHALQKNHHEAVTAGNIDLLDRTLGTSYYGMNMRNEHWARHIKELRAQDPNALIIVMGGAEHLDESIFMAVNRNVKDVSSFTIHLQRRETMGSFPNVFSLSAKEFNQKVTQHLGAQDRYILSFKNQVRADAAKLEQYKPLMGADAIVVLP